MLDYFRSNAQSFGVKFIFGVIILVFVGWGIGSFTDRSAGNVVAKVNGDPITLNDFERAYQMAESEALRKNPSLTREALVQQQLGQSVLNDLVQQILIRQLANEYGLVATPLEMRKAVEAIPAFHNNQGSFDPKVYEAILEGQRISMAEYEQSLALQIQTDKVLNILQDAVWLDQAAAKNHYEYLRQKRTVSYLFVPSAGFDAKEPEEKDIAAYYEQHTASFMVPRKVGLEIIKVSPSLLVSSASLPAEEVKAWYEANKKDFAVAEQVKASHILVPLQANASEAEVKKAEERIRAIRKEIDGGKDFAAVAGKYNGPQAAGPGGDLGWISRGQTVKPFEDAAFALKPGTISDPVRSDFGLHLIKVDEHREASTKPFAEVEEEIRNTLATEQGKNRITDVLDSLLESVLLGKKLGEAAQEHGLKTEQIPLSTQEEIARSLGVEVASVAPLMKLSEGMPLDTPLTTSDTYILCRVEKVEEARTLALAEVRQQIVDTLKNEARLQAAMARAATMRKELKADATPEGAQTGSLDRGGVLPGFAADSTLAKAIFEEKAGEWLAQPYAVQNEQKGEGALLCRVDKIAGPDASEWESMKGIMEQLGKRERAEAVFGIVMQELMSKAKIEILNTYAITRRTDS